MAAKKVKVRFLVDRTVQDEEAQFFAAGETYDLTEDSAEHWLKRGVAELVSNSTAKPKKETKPAEPDSDQ